jgi:hypothetical protein
MRTRGGLTICETRRISGRATDTVVAVRTELTDAEPISDDELAALALAADPDTVVADDAVSLWDLADHDGGLLPDWYMPAVGGGPRNHSRWRRRIALVIVCAFLVVDASGLCSTYGYLVVA